jgi:hypothetical protein
MPVGNRRLFAIFSQPILVRWLSGRKQRFAKAPYPKRVSRVRIPPSPPASSWRFNSLTSLGVFVRITEIRTGPTSGARLAQGVKSEALYLEPKQSFGQSSLTAGLQPPASCSLLLPLARSSIGDENLFCRSARSAWLKSRHWDQASEPTRNSDNPSITRSHLDATTARATPHGRAPLNNPPVHGCHRR